MLHLFQHLQQKPRRWSSAIVLKEKLVQRNKKSLIIAKHRILIFYDIIRKAYEQ